MAHCMRGNSNETNLTDRVSLNTQTAIFTGESLRIVKLMDMGFLFKKMAFAMRDIGRIIFSMVRVESTGHLMIQLKSSKAFLKANSAMGKKMDLGRLSSQLNLEFSAKRNQDLKVILRIT